MSAFVPKPSLTRKAPLPIDTTAQASATTPMMMMIPRGGAAALLTTSVELLTNSLQSGPWGVVGLWAVSSAVVIPFTLYRQAYSFSVGYGYSVMAMALVLLQVFGCCSPLTSAAVFYGARLGSYLLLRNIIVPSKGEQTKSFDKIFPRVKRIPFAASVALFYALLMTPVLYVLRNGASAGGGRVLQVGTVIAWTGALLEAVADTHKLIINRNVTDKKTFVGPTSGLYGITRHPNYTAEILFWFGLLVAGVPSFGKSITAWVCSLLGFYGIYGIMTNATKRLNKRQLENYGGDEAYDKWRAQVKAPLFPFVNSAE